MYNPEKRAWRGRSYKNGRQVKDLRSAYLADNGSEPVEETPAPVLPTFFVVEQTGDLANPTVRRIECEGAEEAVSTYGSLQRSWEYDDRLICIYIEDAEGRSFRPTSEYSEFSGSRYSLPLVEVPSEPSDADLAEWQAREEERMDGTHKDSLYW